MSTISNYAKPDRPKVVLKATGPVFKASLPELGMRTGYSTGHLRRILKGEQVGEPFIAMLISTFGGRFEDHFAVVSGGALKELRPFIGGEAEAELEVPKPQDVPLSWAEAIEQYKLEPETGPPLFEGADLNQPDRVVFCQQTIPVLAYEEDDTIRTYPATKLSDLAMAALAWHGYTNWTGNTLVPRKEQ